MLQVLSSIDGGRAYETLYSLYCLRQAVEHHDMFRGVLRLGRSSLRGLVYARWSVHKNRVERHKSKGQK